MTNYKGLLSFKRIVPIICILLFIVLLIRHTFATHVKDEAYIISLTIQANGEISVDKNLFGDELWYPGYSKQGIIQVYNQYRTMKITDLLILTDSHEMLDGKNNSSFQLLFDHLYLSLSKAVLNETIIEKVSLSDLKEKYHLSESQQISLAKGCMTQLQYTLSMDEAAGNETENKILSAMLVFNVEDLTVPEEPVYKPRKYSVPKPRPTHWACNCIEQLIREGIIEGYECENVNQLDFFMPDGEGYLLLLDNKITRAETAVALCKALDIQPIQGSLPYSDVYHSWMKSYILAATKAGIFEGYPDQTFKPYHPISREEMTAVLMRAFKKSYHPSFELDFKDKDDIAEWALKYIRNGVYNQVIEGYPDRTFRPKHAITRAEAFTILCRLLGLCEMCVE